MKIVIRPSLRLALILLFFHALAVLPVWVTPLPGHAALALVVLISISALFFTARDVWLLMPNSWCEIALQQRAIRITQSNGEQFSAQLADSSFLHPHFIVLRVKPDGGWRTVSRIIVCDALRGDEFRELRVRLKFS
ncbi:MAG: protein YgfX [Pseudomonadota bacterium]